MTVKQELIIPSSKTQLVNSESTLKFDARINTSDLIETVLYEREKSYRDELSFLKEKFQNLENESQKLEKKLDEEIKKLEKNYKNKNIDSMLKILSSLNILKTNKKLFIEYEIVCFNDQYIHIYTKIRRDKYDTIVDLTLKEQIPENILKTKQRQKICDKNLNETTERTQLIYNKIKELPNIKKQIKAEFVKTILKENTLNTKDILEKLRAAIIKE